LNKKIEVLEKAEQAKVNSNTRGQKELSCSWIVCP